MLSLSNPTSLPRASPASAKRDRPYDDDASKPRPRISGPFVDDDEDSESELEAARSDKEPLSKRRMLQHPSNDGVDMSGKTQVSASEERLRSRHDADCSEEAQQNEGQSNTADKHALLWPSQQPVFSGALLADLVPATYDLSTCDGCVSTIKERKQAAATSYESMVASRSKTKEGRAKRSYYGIDIHKLMDEATKGLSEKSKSSEVADNGTLPSVETPVTVGRKSKKNLLWTEKYRARNFVDLCGDDGTNRMVLRWLKGWDPLVFPGVVKSRPVIAKRPVAWQQPEEEKPHRKILMLTGPPGLGKTTLAHVCAKQAGYEVIEVNASDDRSKDVVKNRIRTSLGTESVKTVTNRKDGDTTRSAKPACVVVDEVDGAVAGSGGSGEGGFVKALIDLVLLDQRNGAHGSSGTGGNNSRKRKGDDFRLMRPLILICNDVYHPSLRPLRQSNLAEIIHVGRPSVDAVVGRLKYIFEKEAVPCDKDAARKLCETAWGMSSGIEAKKGAESAVEGDLRGVMVVGEWVAGRFRSSNVHGNQRLSRQWIEQNILHDLANGAAGARGLGRGSARDIVGRLFREGGGFPKTAINIPEAKHRHEQPKAELGFGEQQKKYSMERLREMVDTSGEISHILTEVFAEYPNREFNDDCYLSKPNQAYDWLHFHDSCQSRLFASQEWELAPYLSQPVLACHHLFASPKRHVGNMGYDKRWGADATEEEEIPLPFTGPKADYEAREAEKQNRAQLQAIQAQLTPTLMRSFRSPEDIATEFMPYLTRLVSPDVKPVVVGGSQGSTATVRKESEKAMVKRASEVLAEVGIALQKGKIESDSLVSRGAQYVYRLDPDLDALSTFETGSPLLSSQAPTRYAVRQVLDQELQRTISERERQARQARFKQGGAAAPASSALPFDNKENLKSIIEQAKTATVVKKDFFGRVVEAKPLAEIDANGAQIKAKREEKKVWVTYHEGLNNAVRKPMSLQDFMRGL